MAEIRKPRTIREASLWWLSDSILAVHRRARAFAGGGPKPLLKRRSGKLMSSIFVRLPTSEMFSGGGRLHADVGTKLDYAIKWELEGFQGPIEKKGHNKAFQIIKPGRSAAGLRVRFRKKIYSKKTRVAPKPFLKAALIHEMTGQRGRRKLRKLGKLVGTAVALRYVRTVIKNYGPHVTVIIR